MTKQELFNNTWNHHIVNRRPPGFNVTTQRCVYRGPNGERCAIGVSIPEDYHLPTPNIDVNTLAAKLGWSIMDATRRGSTFPDDLQHQHDSSAAIASENTVVDQAMFHRDYKKRLRALAKRHKLTIPGGN